MASYRIKIEERYNGEKQYIPQCCKLQISKGWIRKVNLTWYNIIPVSWGFELSDLTIATYKTEEAAMKVIEDHKMEDHIKEGAKVKSITYKTIE